ncbi:hypothetical protein ACQP3J_33300, partial [Escherichia coli]
MLVFMLLSNGCSITVSVRLVKPEPLTCGSLGVWLWFLDSQCLKAPYLIQLFTPELQKGGHRDVIH